MFLRFFNLVDFYTSVKQENTFLSYFSCAHLALHVTSVEEAGFGQAQN